MFLKTPSCIAGSSKSQFNVFIGVHILRHSYASLLLPYPWVAGVFFIGSAFFAVASLTRKIFIV